MENIFYFNKTKYRVVPFDNKNLEHVENALRFLKDTFSNAYNNTKENLLLKGVEKTTVLNNGFFIENESGLKIGCVLFGPQSYNVPLVDYKLNTLFIHYLMVRKNYQNQGVGSKLIRSVVNYAKENGYNYVELLSEKYLFETRGNVYEHNNFNKVASFNSQNPFKKNIVFRIGTDEVINNISEYIFNQIKDLKVSQIDEKKIVEEISLKYNDVLKEKHTSSEFLDGLKVNLQKYKKCKSLKRVSGILKAKQTVAIVPFLKKSKYQFSTYGDLIKVFDNIFDLTVNKKIDEKIIKDKENIVIKK